MENERRNTIKGVAGFLMGLICVCAAILSTVSPASAVGSTSESSSTNLLSDLRSEIVAYMEKYQLSPEMPDQALANAYFELDSQDAESAWVTANLLLEQAQDLSEEDADTLLSERNTKLCLRFYNIMAESKKPMLLATAAYPITPVGSVSITSSDTEPLDDWDSTTGVLTVNVAGKSNGCGGHDTRDQSVTISCPADKTLTFSLSTKDVNNIASDNTSVTTAGGTKTLQAGTSVTFTITTGANSTTNILTLSNFTLTDVKDSYNVSVNYNNTLGSVTVGGATVSSGSVQEVTDGSSITVVAVPNSTSKFLAWVDTSNYSSLSSTASYTFTPGTDVNITALFSSPTSTALFSVGSRYFDNLNSAGSYATSSGTSTIILAADGTLPSSANETNGVYTIPAGVTLLIPYDAANTLCTDKPTVHDNAYTKPSDYRTLTMASGANITVNGAISVSGSQSSKYACNGMPSGPLSFIKMSSDSKITVENGANLYVWGYITGSGSVEIKSGGNVHECFQIADYRGGDATSSIVGKDDDYGVFPFNQYYLQNVEVPMTLHAGAKENGYGSVYVTVAGTQEMSIPFIGSEKSMFIITDGYIVKDYIEGTGRTQIDVYGSMNITEVEIDLKVALIGNITIDTSKYALPIPHHFTVSVESGSINMNQSIAFLPGSELYIREYTSGNLGTGKKVYVYDLDQWLYNDGANGYSGTTNLPYMQLKYVPGGDGTTGRSKDALIQVDGTADLSAGSAYVTAGGANIYSTGTGVVKVASTTDVIAYQVITADTSISSWPEIAMQPAILQDRDGTDVKTTAAEDSDGYGEGEYKYYTATQKWCPPGHRYGDGVVTAPTCTAAGYTTHTCIACEEIKTEAGDAATGHTWGDWSTGACSVCDEKAIRYAAINLSIEGEILLNFKYYIHDDAIKVGIKATVTEEGNAIIGPDGNTWTSAVNETFKDRDGVRYVVSQGIAAGEMTGEVTVGFTIDGTAVPIFDNDDLTVSLGTSMTRTVLDFAQAATDNESTSNIALCKGALTFGGYAQLFYGTHTGKLAYEFLNTNKVDNFAPSLDGADAELKQVTQTSLSGNNSVTATTQKLNLDSKIYIRTYFTLPEGKTTDDYTVTISGPTNNGSGTFTDTTQTLVKDDGDERWYVDILNVPPAYWNDTYTITITGNNGTYTVNTSVLAWCARCVNSADASDAQKNMARAMYFYNVAADEYFTEKNGQ